MIGAANWAALGPSVPAAVKHGASAFASEQGRLGGCSLDLHLLRVLLLSWTWWPQVKEVPTWPERTWQLGVCLREVTVCVLDWRHLPWAPPPPGSLGCHSVSVSVRISPSLFLGFHNAPGSAALSQAGVDFTPLLVGDHQPVMKTASICISTGVWRRWLGVLGSHTTLNKRHFYKRTFFLRIYCLVWIPWTHNHGERSWKCCSHPK